jgi:Ohr subfamily peroxiredoxin
MKELFTAEATALSGREGKVVSADGNLEIQLAMPKVLGGASGAGSNPEQLFAGGYSACFSSALALVARTQKIPAGKFTITAHVTLGQDDAGKFALAVKLEGSFPDLDKSAAQALMEAAHNVCPYSDATRGNVAVTLAVA